MRWLQSVPLVTAAAVAAMLLAGAARRPAPEWPRYLLTDREGFLPREAQLVAAPPVADADWSSDGRYVLAVRQQAMPQPQGGALPPAAEVSVVVWNRQTGRSLEIWKRPAVPQMVEQSGWLPGTHTALLVLGWIRPTPEKMELHRTLFWLDTTHGQSRALAELQGERLLISPAQPLAVLFDDGQSTLRVVHADASIGPVVQMPRVSGNKVWSADGRTLYLQTWEAPAAVGLPPVNKWQVIDLQRGTLTPLTSEPPVYQEKPLPVRLISTTMMLKEGTTTRKVRPLWLESTVKSEEPRLLVCADSDGGSLAPDAGAVLYLSQGAAWALPLTRLPKQQVLTQIRAAQRQEALSNARQIALALSMYAQDYDETFPPAGANATSVLRPYIKNDAVLNAPGTDAPGFVYTYTGGPMKTITDPSTQELGYLPGPGGRAVIFADGHAKWQTDAESPGAPAAVKRQQGYFR